MAIPNQRTGRRVLAAAAIVLAAVAIGCGSDDDTAGGAPDEPVTIRMGWGIPAEEIKYVMMRYPQVAPGLGSAYDIEWHEFSGTALGVQGLAAGTLDCATVGGLSVANGLDKGADIAILGEFIEERAGYMSTAWMVRKDSGIDSLADLKGKRVATNAVGGSTDYLQDFYIEQQTGLKPDRDYEKVEVPFGQMQETLLSGRVDMGLFPQPFYGAIRATGEVRAMFRLTDQIEPFVQLLNGCRRDFVDEHDAAMRAFQADWARVARWIAQPANRDKVIEASTAATKIPAGVLERFLLTERDYFRPADGAVNVEALQEEWDFFRARGGIEQELRVTDHVVDLDG
jgi:ABC-type nitrate/sulfonate/bicarbonate transport system substrate-binding protein